MSGAGIFASITGQLTSAVATHGVAAVFVLMALDALVPAGGELIMLYAGVLAAGTVIDQHVTVLGVTLNDGVEAFVVLALAGAVGYLVGSLAGWAIGRRGGRPLVERHGTWLHLSPARFARAERWFARHGDRAVFLGRLTPLVRSFISVTAGVLGSPLRSYTVLTWVASLIWCFAFAGAGWALGSNWETVHRGFGYVEIAGVTAAVLAASALLMRRRRL